jgi:hypothetical protein
VALCQILGKADDCALLHKLRAMQAELVTTDEGKVLIAEYQELGPHIATALAALPEPGRTNTAKQCLVYLSTAADMYDDGNMLSAVDVYKRMVKMLRHALEFNEA